MASSELLFTDPEEFLKASPLQDQISTWEIEISFISGVRRIPPAELEYLSNKLSTESDVDSYLTSPVYYAFTGRHGLWIYERNESYIPFCWHPNVTGKILIFPTRGKSAIDLTTSFLSEMPEPPKGFQLARIKTGDNKNTDLQIDDIKTQEQIITLSPFREQILDWKYPVHILSTSSVAQMEGPNFHRIRNHVRSALKQNIEVRNIKDVSSLDTSEFISCWAKDFAANKKEADDLASLYKKLFSFSSMQALKTDGLVAYVEGTIQAITLWDTSNSEQRTANRFMNLCSTKICRGLADYMMKQTSLYLVQKGIQYLNIGGAETESLDYYKRKYQPVQSIQLLSIEGSFKKRIASFQIKNSVGSDNVQTKRHYLRHG